MMWESAPWKNQLLRTLERLERRTKQRRWPAASFSGVEMEVMGGFYMVRKLIDARTKLSTKVMSMPVPLTSFALREDQHVDLMNWHWIEKHYDLEHPTEQTRDVVFVCNQMVHTFVFWSEHNEKGGLSSILFSSDRKRNDQLYRIAIGQVLRIFAIVANDYPFNLMMKRGADGDFREVEALGILDMQFESDPFAVYTGG